MNLALLFFASYVHIFLRAFQTQNVIHGNYLLSIITSVGIATYEVFMVVSVVHADEKWPLVLAIGIGAGLGACSSMWVHRVMRSKMERKGQR